MTERLIIRNFAGLEDIDIELGRINIFIGPQASGKSVCAKLLYWFKSFVPVLMESVNRKKTKREYDAVILSRFKEYFPNLWRTNQPYFLRYEVAESYIQLIGEKNKTTLSYSSSFRFLGETIRKVHSIADENLRNLPSNNRIAHQDFDPYEDSRIAKLDAFASKLIQQMGKTNRDSQSFILAGRSFFSSLKGAVLTFLASTTINDPILRDFIKLYEQARFSYPFLGLTKPLSTLVQFILKGELDTKGEDDFIVMTDGKRVPLNYASSGQQEAFPLILILSSLALAERYYTDEPTTNNTFYVEEPEAHLYPDSQLAIVQLMSGIFNTTGWLLQYVITTHSPYLLAAFNNLIYARELAERFKDEPDKLKALYKVVPKNQQVGIENFRVYRLKGGKAMPIISKNNLIVAEELDEVSEKMSQQFDRLMDLEQPLHETSR